MKLICCEKVEYKIRACQVEVHLDHSLNELFSLTLEAVAKDTLGVQNATAVQGPRWGRGKTPASHL